MRMDKERCWHILSEPWAGMVNWCEGDCVMKARFEVLESAREIKRNDDLIRALPDNSEWGATKQIHRLVKAIEVYDAAMKAEEIEGKDNGLHEN